MPLTSENVVQDNQAVEELLNSLKNEVCLVNLHILKDKLSLSSPSKTHKK